MKTASYKDHRMLRNTLRLALAAGVLALAATPLPAATVTWDNGAGDSLWASPANWNPDGVPLATDDVVFGTGMVLNQFVDMGGNRTVNSLTFIDTGANTIRIGLNNTADVLTLASGNLSRTDDRNTSHEIRAGLLLGANGVFNNAASSGRALNVMNSISDGGNGYTITIGSGQFRFDAANSYGGGTVIQSGGRLFLNSTAQSLGSGGATVESGGYLDFRALSNLASGQTVHVDSLGILALPTNFDPSSALTATSSGIVALRANNSSITDLSALGNGAMFLGAAGENTLTSASLAPGNGATYRLGGGGAFTLTIQNAVLTGANDVVVGQSGGAGRVLFGAAMTYGGTTTVNAYHALGATVSNAFPGDTIQVAGSGGLRFGGNAMRSQNVGIAMQGTDVFIETSGVNWPNYVTLSGTISDGGNGYRLLLPGGTLFSSILGAQNNANIALTGANTYSGGTHINGNGIDLVIAASSTVDGGGTILHGPYGKGAITTGAGSGGTAAYKHRYHVLSGDRTIHNPWSFMGTETRVNVAADSSLTLVGAVTGGWFDKWAEGTLALTGTTALTGTGVYLGVAEGTLRVNGPYSAPAGIRVMGGTLGGTGVVDGDVAFAARGNRNQWHGIVGGMIAPGTSTGILQVGTPTSSRTVDFTVAYSGTLQSGLPETLGTATFRAAMHDAAAGAVTGYSQLKVHGNVNLAGATLDVVLLEGFAADASDEFTILRVLGGTLSGTFAGLAEDATVEVDGSAFTITYTGGDGQDVVLRAQGAPATLILLR